MPGSEIITEYLKTRSLMGFISLMRDQHVDTVVDIRFGTRWPVYFRPDNLQNELRKSAIIYLPLHSLGNPSRLRKQAGSDFRLAKKLYLDHIKNKIELELLKRLISDSDEKFCFICYCNTTDEQKCHRFWLKEAIENEEMA